MLFPKIQWNIFQLRLSQLNEITVVLPLMAFQSRTDSSAAQSKSATRPVPATAGPDGY